MRGCLKNGSEEHVRDRSRLSSEFFGTRATERASEVLGDSSARIERIREATLLNKDQNSEEPQPVSGSVQLLAYYLLHCVGNTGSFR